MSLLVTSGLGGSGSSLIVQGFSLTPSIIVAAIERPLRLRQVGQSGTKRRLLQELEPVMVWARLVETNGYAPKRPVSGHVIQEGPVGTPLVARVEHVSTRVIEPWERVKVTVRRLLG